MLSEEFKKKLAAIPEEEPDEIDRQMIAEAKEEDDISAYEWKSLKKEMKKEREARKKKGDLHVRIAASLHEEIIDDAESEGISLNQYVATALAYYAGRNRTKRV